MDPNHASPPAAVLGGDTIALSVARSLHAAGVTVHVLDHPKSVARFSRAVSEFVDVGTERQQERMLEWLRAAELGAVVLAGSDDGVELIARHRSELVQLGYHPAEGNDEVLLAMLDKLRTYELARQHGIAVPHTIRLRDEAGLEMALQQLEFPCILKPVHSHHYRRHSSAKVIAVSNAGDLRREFAQLTSLGLEMFVTEVIYGDSDLFVSYYGYLDPNGVSLVHFTKRKLRQHPPGFGIGTYHETTDDPEVAAAGLAFLQAVAMRGVGNVEFKRDTRDGRLVLIECNARFTQANELVRAAGVDLALLSYNRALGRPTSRIDGYRVGLNLWDPLNDLRALRAYRRRGELSARSWARSLLHPQRFPTLRADDPLPGLFRASWLTFCLLYPRLLKPRLGRGAPSQPPTAVVPSTASRLPQEAQSPSVRARVLDAMATRAGRRGRTIAARVDSASTFGLRTFRLHKLEERGPLPLGDEVRSAVYEGIWTHAAENCGADIRRLSPGLFELSRDGARTRVYQQVIGLDGPATLHAALDKTLVHRLMRENDVRHPDHLEWNVNDPGKALSFLESVGGPCVVKPAADTLAGFGVVPGIESVEDLMRARWHIGRGTDRLLIERQAKGSVYRLLLFDGELLDVVRQGPPRVTGDGHSTIRELIAEENERRMKAIGAAGLYRIRLDLDTALTLKRAGLTLSSVPADGQRILISVVTNGAGSDDNETWRESVCPSVQESALRLAAAVGLHLAGVDVVTTDITKPLAETDGVITEVNGNPGLHHHYLVADPAHATPVAIPVLERLLARNQ